MHHLLVRASMHDVPAQRNLCGTFSLIAVRARAVEPDDTVSTVDRGPGRKRNGLARSGRRHASHRADAVRSLPMRSPPSTNLARGARV